MSAISCTKLVVASKGVAWPAPSISCALAAGIAEASDPTRRNMLSGVARAARANDRDMDGCELCRGWIRADGIAEVLGLPSRSPSPLHCCAVLGKGVPSGSAITVRVGRAQQHLCGISLPAAQGKPSDPRERRDLGSSRNVTSEPPWELMGDDDPHEVQRAPAGLQRSRPRRSCPRRQRAGYASARESLLHRPCA